MREMGAAVNLVGTWRGFTKRRKAIWLGAILGLSVLMSVFVILATLAIDRTCWFGPYRFFP
jgi:hypothetical protein